MVNLQEIPITDLIPQRPPMVMVDRVLHSSRADTETVFEIREDNILLEDGHLTMAGLIENMTQSCACRMGCNCLLDGTPVKIGVVGEIKNCTLERLPKVGEILHTHVCIMEEVMHLTQAGVVVMAGEETIATSRLKIAIV